MARTKFPAQVYRSDGKNCFCEILCNALSIDKAVINFISYDASKPKGSRETGSISIFMDILDAGVLAKNIFSGRLAKLAADSKSKAAKEGKKYPEPVYFLMGGTPAKNTPDHKAICRQLRIVPGNAKPWVLEASMGLGKESKEGLISMDGVPTSVIRIPLDDEGLKRFAVAMELMNNLWVNAKFAPVVSPLMDEVRERVMESMQQHAKDNDAMTGPEPDDEYMGNIEDECAELPY